MVQFELAPQVAETHISTVMFVGDRAYKLLKPVATSFLDHSTTALRLGAIDLELELNRRLAPDVYLGTADVVEGGELVDRFLVMQRLPNDRRLSALVDTDGFADAVRSVARAIAVFHAQQPPMVDTNSIAGREAVAANWADNMADVAQVSGQVIDPADIERVRVLVAAFVDHRGVLFDERIEGGFVRDGHGDLTAEDTFVLDDGPRLIDCLAFDTNLRVCDVLLDVAFLAMDLDRLAGPEMSRRFLAWYCEFTNEHHPSALAHHYVAYRAHVRAKVAAIRYLQGDRAQAAVARAYHDLCLRHLERAAPTVLLIGGSPGTGKTTLAHALGDRLGYLVLSSDELRKDLAGRGHHEHDVVAVDDGIYSEASTDATYRTLLEHADAVLQRAHSVVLDASWHDDTRRAEARALAQRLGARVVEVECVVAAEVAKTRIAERLDAGVDASDALPAMVDLLRSRFVAWPTAHRVDTSHGLSHTVESVLRDAPL